MEVGGGAREVRSEYAVSSAMGRCFRVGLREACNFFTLALAGPQVPGSARKCQGVAALRRANDQRISSRIPSRTGMLP